MKVGVIGAMEIEIDVLRDQMTISDTKELAGMTFCVGEIGKNALVLVRSGVGKVNAGICAALLRNVFNVDCIINTGAAGSLNNDLDIGDILVSRDALYHDVDATVFGYEKGEVPQLGVRAFEADEKLVETAVETVRAAAPDVKAAVGRVASGDQFISDSESKNRIRKDTQADCCEMEGAAIAQACYLNKVPFVIIRAISDKADGSRIVDYPVFEEQAARHCAKIVGVMLERLGRL